MDLDEWYKNHDWEPDWGYDVKYNISPEEYEKRIKEWAKDFDRKAKLTCDWEITAS